MRGGDGTLDTTLTLTSRPERESTDSGRVPVALRTACWSLGLGRARSDELEGVSHRSSNTSRAAQKIPAS